MKIAVEYIKWLQEERSKINKVSLDKMEFYENGMKVDIDKTIIDDFKFTGLVNIDFILSGFYKFEKDET